MDSLIAFFVFQFHNGAIKRGTAYDNIEFLPGFQFHNGAIKSTINANTDATFVRFNSIMVL